MNIITSFKMYIYLRKYEVIILVLEMQAIQRF